VSQVALECGYNNYSNFNRQFNRIAGMTPLAYRKKYVK
jgi:AraC-like DNA-binding protein